MKVNTDGVLLPAWLSLPARQGQIQNEGSFFKVLDIGSGTGVISLIIAQRLEEEFLKNSPNNCGVSNLSFAITAIDVDYNSYFETLYNFENSLWKERLEALHISLQDYIADLRVSSSKSKSLLSKLDSNNRQFDLIISNPPFFTNSLNAPSHRRSIARHSHSLPLELLIDSAALLLKEGGLLAVILPVEEGERFLKLAFACNLLAIKRLCKVKTLLNKPAKRYMIELIKLKRNSSVSGGELLEIREAPLAMSEAPLVIEQETLIVQQEGGEYYTHEYNELVKNFYLKDLKVKSI